MLSTASLSLDQLRDLLTSLGFEVHVVNESEDVAKLLPAIFVAAVENFDKLQSVLGRRVWLEHPRLVIEFWKDYRDFVSLGADVRGDKVYMHLMVPTVWKRLWPSGYPVLAWLCREVPSQVPRLDLDLGTAAVLELLRPFSAPQDVATRFNSEERVLSTLLGLATLRNIVARARELGLSLLFPFNYTKVREGDVELIVPATLHEKDVDSVLRLLRQYFTVPVSARAVPMYWFTHVEHILVVEPQVEDVSTGLAVNSLEALIGWLNRGRVVPYLAHLYEVLNLQPEIYTILSPVPRSDIYEVMLRHLRRASSLEKAVDTIESMLIRSHYAPSMYSSRKVAKSLEALPETTEERKFLREAARLWKHTRS